MISPSPTQQSSKAPDPGQGAPSTADADAAQESRGSQGIKPILRPIIKVIYYVMRAVAGHKFLTFVAILLLLASISVTNYYSTGVWPFGLGNDPFNFHVNGTNGGGDKVRDWLYALRAGDTSTLSLLDADMSQPPDPNQLVSQFAQSKTRTWKAINVLSAYSESDSSIDSFVEVDFSSNGPGGPVNGIALWHFITVAGNGQEALLKAELVDFRKPLQ